MNYNPQFSDFVQAINNYRALIGAENISKDESAQYESEWNSWSYQAKLREYKQVLGKIAVAKP